MKSVNSLTEYPSCTFTNIELEIIQLICEQYFNDEIAKKLSINQRTVETIRKSIKAKMKVKGTPGIVVYAIKHNIYQV